MSQMPGSPMGRSPLKQIIKRMPNMLDRVRQPMPVRPPQQNVGSGSLFDTPNQADYNRLVMNAPQEQYSAAPNPYAAQAEYLMNRPVFDRGAGPTNPMFLPRTEYDPLEALARQPAPPPPMQAPMPMPAPPPPGTTINKGNDMPMPYVDGPFEPPIRRPGIPTPVGTIRTMDFRDSNNNGIDDRDEMGIGNPVFEKQVEPSMNDGSTIFAGPGWGDDYYNEIIESERLAEEAEAERLSALQAQFGNTFSGPFGGNFNISDIQESIAAAQAANVVEPVAENPAISPDLQTRIAALQGQFDNFGMPGKPPIDMMNIRSKNEKLSALIAGLQQPAVGPINPPARPNPRVMVPPQSYAGIDLDSILSRLSEANINPPAKPNPRVMEPVRQPVRQGRIIDRRRGR